MSLEYYIPPQDMYPTENERLLADFLCGCVPAVLVSNLRRDINFELESCEMSRFDDMPTMDSWLKNGPEKTKKFDYSIISGRKKFTTIC